VKLRKSLLLLLILTLALGTVLAACGGGDTTEEPPADTTTDPGNDTGDDTATTEDPEEAKKGGTVAFSMYSAPAGVFNPVLYGDAYEANVIGFVFQSLVGLDENLSWEPELAKDWSFENDNKTVVFNLEEGVKWHDGEPFTANDVKYTYEVMAHPDYTGVRSNYASDLQGFDEYNAGEAEEVTGLEVVDDHTIKFHFKEPNVVALYRASFSIIPEHIYGKYEVADLATAPETLEFTKLVGTGPFKASDAVTNESYSLVRNDDYWEGAPYLDGVVWRVINQDVAPGLLESGEIDVVTDPGGVRPADYELVAGIPGIKMHEAPDFGYQYMGYKLNYRPKADIEAGVVKPENFIPNEKLQDVKLRQAITHAINRQGIVDGLIFGRGTVLNAPFPPTSWAFDASAVNNYPYEADTASAILDEAGYKDTDGDGFRERPNGEQLVLRLDFPSGNKVREQSAPIIAQNLKDVGLNIDLRSPRDIGAYYDAVENDEEGMDLFLAGWGLSTADPDPKGIWDTTTLWNFPRWNDPHQQELIDAGVKSPEAFDQQYRKDIYNEWASYVNEQLPYTFLYAQNNIWAYNEKIQNVIEEGTGISRDIHKWYLAE
jgi:peptide/nickel transport system substrate-binding protein